jgi:hypothetical protein
MIMAFFIVFSYATNFFNIFSYEQLAAVTPIVVLHHPSKHLEDLDLHLLTILFMCLAMVRSYRANRLGNLLHRLRTQTDDVVDGIIRFKPIYFDFSSLAIFRQ